MVYQLFRTTCLLFISLFFAVQTFSQFTGALSGVVLNKNTQAPLSSVSLQLQPDNLNVLADSSGRFRFKSIAPGSYSLLISRVGYLPKTISNLVITTGNENTINIELEEDLVLLSDVVVTSGSNKARAATLESPLSIQRLTTEDIKANPGGNFDVSRVIQSLPGVGGGAAGGSFRNDIIIRGGAPGENVFYLDGIEVPVINHFSTQGSGGGPQGILNVSFIEEVTLSTSAFDARYDNALSSVFQFKQKEGNRNRLQGNIRLSATEVAATFDGPVTGKTTFIGSVRRSYLQLLFKALDLPIRPNYWDFQFKTTTRINNKTTLSFLGIGAIDEFSFAAPKNATPEKLYVINSNPLINQKSYTVGAVLKKLTRNGFWNLSVSRNTLQNNADKYEDNEQPVEQDRNLGITSNETENKLRFNVTQNSGGFKLNYGAVAQFVQFDNSFFQLLRPELKDAQGNVIQSRQVLQSNSSSNFLRYGAFVQGSRRFFKNRLGVSAGFRIDANSLANSEANPFKQVSPRLSASYTLAPKWNLSASYGLYYRLPGYTQLAYRNAAGEAVNPGKYIQSQHYVAGLAFIPTGNSRFTLEGFYKKYNNYGVSITDGISLANKGTEFGAVGNEPVVQDGKGRAYGFEFFAQQKLAKRIFGVFSYTMFWSEFTGLNGRYAPASWDNRHLLSLTAGYKFNKNWELGLKFRYQGAAPYTAFDEVASRLNYLTLGTGVFNYGQVNELRLPAFSAGDIRVDKKWNLKRFTIDIFVEVQNFLGADAAGIPQYTFRRNMDNTAFLSTDNQPVKQDGSNAIPLLLDNRDGNILPTLGIILEF